jgi:transcriptional regulator with XRE-family HTH domain
MLPSCDLTIRVSRTKYLPSHSRGIPVPNEPTTIGGHLRRRRLQLKINQSEAARILEVSTVTLSRWECDKVYPTWDQQPRIIAYLGYDPFTDPALGRPLGNETHDVAFLSSTEPLSFGQQIINRRLELKKTGKQCAKELGVSDKTLRGWETGRREPTPELRKRAAEFFGLPGME